MTAIVIIMWLAFIGLGVLTMIPLALLWYFFWRKRGKNS